MSGYELYEHFLVPIAAVEMYCN